MIEKHRNRWYHMVMGLFVSLALLLVGGVLLHWSWNTFAAEVLLGAVITIATLSGRLCARTQRDSVFHAKP